MAIAIQTAPMDGQPAARLLEQLIDGFTQSYGGGTTLPYDAALFAEPEGRFVLVLDDGEPVGCGGFIRYDDETAELKRMYVVPKRRGQGISRLLLHELEASAAAAGYRSMVLETGDLQIEAIALYRSAGYLPIPCYPPYADRGLSLCFARAL